MSEIELTFIRQVTTNPATAGGVEVVTTWNGGFLGDRYSATSSGLAVSPDGEVWEPLGVEQLLPEGLSWGFDPIAAGEAGIAAVATGYDESMGFEEPEPFVLEKDGYALTADEMRSSLVLSEGDTEVLRLFLDSGQVHEEVAVDFPTRTVTFIDPATDDPVVTFTFDELDEAQQASYEGMDESREQRAFLFSRDGSEWSVQDLTDIVGENAFVSELLVRDDQVIAVLAQVPISFATGPPSIPPTVQIWTAPTP